MCGCWPSPEVGAATGPGRASRERACELTNQRSSAANGADERQRGGYVSDSALVVTVSTRAAAGVYEDRSGPVVVEGLRELGFVVGEPVVVPDGDEVGAALRAAVTEEHAVVITTGGTGLS